MKSKPPAGPPDQARQIEDLVRRLRETERELQALTGGGVDAVTQIDGKPYLLAEAQEKLRISEVSLREASAIQAAILNTLPAHVALLDPQGVIVTVNDSWRRFAFDNQAQNGDYFLGQNYLKVCEASQGNGAEFALEAAKGIRRVIGGELKEFVLEYPCHAPAENRWFRMIVTGFNGDQNKGAVVTHINISARKQMEDSLRQREKLLQMAGKAARLGGWSVDYPEGRVTWSDEVCLIRDVPLGTVPALDHAFGYYAPESKKRVMEAYDRCVREGTPYDLEAELFTAKGRRLWVRILGQAERNQEDGIIRIQGAFQDITDRKNSELKLEQANRALQMLSRCNEAIIHAENETEILNEICRIAVGTGGYALAWVGYAMEDQGKRVLPLAQFGASPNYLNKFEISWDAQKEMGKGPAGRTIRGGKAVVVPDLDREKGFANWRDEAKAQGFKGLVCLPLKNSVRTFGILALYQSSTLNLLSEDIRRLQELADDLAFGILALRERKERRLLLESVLTIARGVSGTIGLDFFEQMNRNLVAALRADGGYILILDPLASQNPKTVSVIVDGNVIDNFEYDLEGTPFENIAPGEVCCVEKGVRERYPRDPFLVELGIEGYVGMPLKNSSDKIIGLMAVFFRGPISQKNFIVSTLQIFGGRAASELERRGADEQVREQAALLDGAHEAILVKDLEDKIIYWNKGAQKAYGWTAAEVSDKKDHELLYNDRGKFEEAKTALFMAGEWEGETVKKTKDGRELVVEVSWTLVRDNEGRPKSILEINSDITEKKKLESQFLRAQRMESIGTMAGGIAHDLNNILAPIMMTADLMKLDIRDPELLELLETIKLSAQRGSDMVKQVLSFSRGFEGERVPVDMAEVIRSLKKILGDTFPKNVVIDVISQPNPWTVLADPSQLNQVILNLCVNARDAMPDGGTITIQIENQMLDNLYIQMNPGSKPGSYLLVRVTDTGGGIPQEIQERIFDPFFTTKEVGKGTGLGLSTVLGIVKSLGGFINLYSEMGRGATFKIYLPAKASEVEKNAREIEQSSLPRGRGELILVVDDEEIIRVTVKKTLERFGYRIHVASHGAEAVALYSKIGDSISAVITDMSMPIMDGPSTIVALKSLNPNVVIIGSSGFHANVSIGKAVGAGVKYFISKPYSAEAMLRTLRQAIDDSPKSKLSSFNGERVREDGN